jgi:signal transduction histidine kinase
MVHNEDKAVVLQRAEQAIQGIDLKPLEHRIIHQDGSIRWVRNSIVLYKDDKGKVISYDGLINDITELKIAEEKTEAKQRQLIQADKMATLGTMISGIAHEVNNPNNFILLNARFLQKVWEDIIPIVREYSQTHDDYSVAGFPANKSNEKIIQSLEGIINGALRIQKITKSLTNFARVDAGELDLPVDINNVISNAVLLTGNLVKNSTDNFSVKCNYEKELPLIKGNAQQLEQVMINLINNACQSLTNKNQKVLIIISIYGQPPVISIRIEDEGVGIEKENLKNIFDPFFTTKRSSGGTGLGLYVSYKIIKDHGGDLTVTSEKGMGTKCEIILPIT